MSSVFTQIIQRKLDSNIVYEDELFIAILDINPIDEGHLLVIPKEEIDSLFDLDEETYSAIWRLVKKLETPLKAVTGAPRIGIAVEGFSVSHVHIHMVPVHKEGDLDPNRAVGTTVEKLRPLEQRLKDEIGRCLM